MKYHQNLSINIIQDLIEYDHLIAYIYQNLNPVIASIAAIISPFCPDALFNFDEIVDISKEADVYILLKILINQIDKYDLEIDDFKKILHISGKKN